MPKRQVSGPGERVLAALLRACEGAERTGTNAIAWESSAWRTRASAGTDSAGRACLRVSTEAVHEPLPLPPATLPEVNTLAALASFVPNDAGDALTLLSSCPLEDEEPEVASMLGFLALSMAVLQPVWLDGLVRTVAEDAPPRRKARPAPEHELPPEGDEPSAWAEADFEALAQSLAEGPILATADEGGLTAEVPLGEGMVSAALGQDVALLRLDAGMSHPFLGNGLFCSLHVPLPADMDADAAVMLLTRAEMALGDDLLGGWCRDRLGPASVAFVSFFPNMTYRPELAPWLVLRQVDRATWAHATLSEAAEPG